MRGGRERWVNPLDTMLIVKKYRGSSPDIFYGLEAYEAYDTH